MQTDFITELIQRKPRDVRCHGCGSLLGRFIKTPGSLFQVRCRKCGKMYHEDVPVNATSVIVFLRALEQLNGSTPAGIIHVMRYIVSKHDKII
jgi:phage FluMu protein Com